MSSRSRRHGSGVHNGRVWICSMHGQSGLMIYRLQFLFKSRCVEPYFGQGLAADCLSPGQGGTTSRQVAHSWPPYPALTATVTATTQNSAGTVVCPGGFCRTYKKGRDATN